MSTEIQREHNKQWLVHNTQYGYCMYDFDVTTGFDLWSRLTEHDKEHIKIIAEMVLG